MKNGILVSALAIASLLASAPAMAKTLKFECGSLHYSKMNGPQVSFPASYQVFLDGDSGSLITRPGGGGVVETPLTLETRGMDAHVFTADNIRIRVLNSRFGTTAGTPKVSIEQISNIEWSSNCTLINKLIER